MVDLHCHILPGLDDGAETIEAAARMLRLCARSGVDAVAATPHCSADDPALPERMERILRGRDALARLAQELALNVTVYAGMELLCGEGLARTLRRGEFLTLAGSRYLLIEFDFDVSAAAVSAAAAMVADSGKTPVLAHPERYACVQEDPMRAAQWFEAGYLLQLNKGSVLGRFGDGPLMAADWLLQNGLIHLMASDAHAPDIRTPDMRQAAAVVSERYSPVCAEILLERNPRRVLQDRPVLRPDEV